MRHPRKMNITLRNLKPPPKSRSGLAGPVSGWRRGVHQHWQRVRLRAIHAGNLSSRPLSLLFYLAPYFSVLSQDHVQGYLIFLVHFFRGCASCMKPVFCSGSQTACSWRQAAWKLKASDKWSFQWLDK